MNLKLKAKILLGIMLLAPALNLGGITHEASAAPPMLSSVECPAEKFSLEDLLFSCVWLERASDIAVIVASGVNLNAIIKDGHTALHLAVIKNSVNVVRALLDAGINVDVLNSAGDTALITAAKLGCNDIAKLLLERGANPNVLSGAVPEVASCDSWSPLHIAALNNNLDLVKLLLDHKADPNVYAGNGMTPLHCAAVRGYVDIVTALLIGKANIDATTKPAHGADGRLIDTKATALQLARASKNRDVVTVLTEACNIVNNRLNSGL